MTKRRLAPLLLAAAVLLCGQSVEGASLTGKVVRKEGGQPIRGASLWAAPGIVNARTPPSAITGPDGSFEISDPPAGPFALFACAGGHLPWTLILGSAAAQTGPLAVALEPAAEIRGRVLDAKGRPVSGVSVLGERPDEDPAFPSGITLHPCAARERTDTDAEGRFTFAHLEPGRYTLRVQTADRTGGEIREVEAPAGAVVDGLEIRLGPTGLTVRVINDLDARPVRAAQVSVVVEKMYLLEDEPQIRRQTTAANGIARLPDLPEGTLWLQISRDGFAPSLEKLELALGEWREVGVRLPPGGTLAGRVLDETGQPVPDAEVGVWQESSTSSEGYPPESLEERTRQTRTDARGRFGLRDLVAGEAEVWVRHPSFLPLRTRSTVLAGQRVEAGPLVLRRGATVTGTVTDPDGRPLAGVRLTGGSSPVTTGADGSFTLTGLEPGVLRAEADGYLTELRSLCRFDAPLSLTLWPRGSRRIPGPDGKPVESAGVHVATVPCESQERRRILARAFDPDGSPLDKVQIQATREIPDQEAILNLGRAWPRDDHWLTFELLPARPASLLIQAPGHESVQGRVELGEGDAQVVALLPREDLKECRPPGPPPTPEPSTVFAIPTAASEPEPWPRGLKIIENKQATAWLRGRVLAPDGRPVAGATVRTRPAARDPWALLDTRLLYSERWFKIPEATTDAEGRFALGSLSPGWVRAVAHAGSWTGRSDPLRLDEGGTVEVEVRLQPRAALTGRVLDQAGQPIEGASVSVAGERTVAAADGSFRFIGLPPGPAQVSADDVPYEELTRDVEIGDGETRVDLVLAPNQECACVPVLARGRVTGPDGAPVAGAEVSVRNRDETRSAADGSFEILLPILSPEEIIVRKPGLAVGSVIVEGAPAAGVEIRLEPEASITGRVLGLAEGEPAEDDLVWLRSTNGPLLSAPIRPDGTFEATQVPPGTWELTTEISERRTKATVVLPPGRREVQADLVLPPVRPVSGRVVDELGRPIAGAELVAWWEDQGDSMTSGTTRADGSFGFELPDGTYHLIVDQDGFRRGEISALEVRGGPVAGLEVRLERGIVLHGRLLGLPWWKRPDLTIKSARSGPLMENSSGWTILDRYSIPGLAPGLWTIEAETQFCKLQKTFEIPAGISEMELDLDMTPTEAEEP